MEIWSLEFILICTIGPMFAYFVVKQVEHRIRRIVREEYDRIREEQCY